MVYCFWRGYGLVTCVRRRLFLRGKLAERLCELAAWSCSLAQLKKLGPVANRAFTHHCRGAFTRICVQTLIFEESLPPWVLAWYMDGKIVD